MRFVARYALAGLGFVTLVVLALWPWMEPAARRGLLAAALVAYPVQLVAFFLLIRFRHRNNRFLAVWAGGTVVRLGLVLGFGLALFRVSWMAPLPALLGLAGFLFGLLLLEPFFFPGAPVALGRPILDEGR